MISTYDDEIDTITQIMIDWFTNRIRQLDEFNQDQIYQSTLMIDEKTPLPNARITLRVRNGKYLIYKNFRIRDG